MLPNSTLISFWVWGTSLRSTMSKIGIPAAKALPYQERSLTPVLVLLWTPLSHKPCLALVIATYSKFQFSFWLTSFSFLKISLRSPVSVLEVYRERWLGLACSGDQSSRTPRCGALHSVWLVSSMMTNGDSNPLAPWIVIKRTRWCRSSSDISLCSSTSPISSLVSASASTSPSSGVTSSSPRRIAFIASIKRLRLG